MTALFTRNKTKNTQAKRKNPRQWNVILRRLILLGISAIVGLAGFWIYQTTKPSVAPISKIKINATFSHIEQRKLQSIITPYLANGFFYLNVIGLKHQLLNTPWINSVSIQREWPDTITIGITEKKALARWGNQALFTNDGSLFYPETSTIPTNLPVLLGTDDQAKYVFQSYRQMQLQLFPAQFYIQQIFLSPQHYWQLLINTGTKILISEKNSSQELTTLLNLYPKIMQGHNKPPISIDLRYSNGVAVNWGEDPTINNEKLKTKS